MKKQILFFDAAKHKSHMIELETAKQSAQELLNHFNGLSLPLKIQSISELQRLANDGETYIRERLANDIEQDIPKFGLFKMNKQKAVDLLELPNFDGLNTLVNSLPHDLKRNISKLTTDGKTIELDQKAIEAVKDQHTTYADTKEKMNLLHAYNDAVDALNKLQEAGIEATGERIINGYTKVTQLINVDEDGLKTKPWFFEGLRGQIYKHEHREG